MTAKEYCARCTAPKEPAIVIFMRCGPCAVVNGKLPPTKYKEIRSLK
jgi:hypothetical protein